MLPLSPLLLLVLGCRWAAGALAASTALATVVKSYENDTVLLPCHVEDLGLQTRVRWWRAGELLADSEEPVSPDTSSASQRRKMWANRSLELVQVRPEDSGEYICQASRPEPWGHVTQVHEIQVMYPASVRAVPESGQLEVSLGEAAVLGCEAEGVPAPSISWSFEGQELPVLAAGPGLRIEASNRSLAGLYTCEASNGIGEPARASIDLRIRHKPEVRARSQWQHGAPGVRARLECLVVAWPRAAVEWLLEGELLGRSQRRLRYVQDEAGGQLHSLVIRSTSPQDLGQYACRARNELGVAEAGIELSGLAKPPHLKRQSRPAAAHSCSFVWEVDSYSPVVEYQFWFRQLETEEDWRRLFVPSGGEAAGPLHARAFNLTGLHGDRRYEALVLARNRFGWSSPSNTVLFATLPAPPAEEEPEELDSAGNERTAPAVQVTSDSRPMDASSASTKPPRLSPLLLPALMLAACARGPTTRHLRSRRL